MSFPIALGLAWLVLKENTHNKSLNIEGQLPSSTLDATSDKASKTRKLSKWSYVGVVLGSAALLGFFLPKLFNGSLQGKDFIGIGFWMIVIAISGKNIIDNYRAKKA